MGCVKDLDGEGDFEDLDGEGDGAGRGPEDVHGLDLASLQHKAYHAMVRPNITYQLLTSKPHFLQPTPLPKANLKQIDKIRSRRGGPNSGVGANEKVQKRKATADTSSDRETSDDQSSDDLQPFKKHAPAANNRQPSKQHAASAASERTLAFYKSRIANHFAPKFKSNADAKAAEEFFHGTFDSMRMAVMDQPGLADGIQDELLDRIYDRLFARALVYPVSSI